MKKCYNTMGNVGKVKYLVNFHDGKSTHKDGSPFFDVACFSNKKKEQAFIKQLQADGYQERGLAI
jgi:hypothetical protein